MREILQKFCAHPGKLCAPSAIRAPFSRGEYSYATDGSIMLRVPRIADIPENKDAPKRFESWFEIKGQETSLPDVEVKWFPCKWCEEEEDPPTCRNCYGNGKGFLAKPVQIGDSYLSNLYIKAIQANLKNPKITIVGMHTICLITYDGGDGVLMPCVGPRGGICAPSCKAIEEVGELGDDE